MVDPDTNKKAVLKIKPASEYPYELHISQDYLIGWSSSFIDSVAYDDEFEDRMIARIDDREDQVEREEAYLEKELRSYKPITDTRIMHIIDNVQSLDKSQVAVRLFFVIFNKIKARYLTGEQIKYLNARFFPPAKLGLQTPVTYRDMKKITKRSVRTNHLHIERAIGAIREGMKIEFPKFDAFLHKAGIEIFRE